MNGASLKRNAFLLIGAVALIAIMGDWSGDPRLALLWRFAAVVLLAGLAYESWVIARIGLRLEVQTPPHFFLGRVCRWILRSHSNRAATGGSKIAPAAPIFSRWTLPWRPCS